MRYLAPDWLERIDAYEDGFGRSIQRTHGIRVLADGADPTRPTWINPTSPALRSSAWDEPALVRPSTWTMPAGAFGDGSSPS
jgi:hypothetical protein